MNNLFLGIDTSNYTTSLALCKKGEIIARIQRLLPVDEGKCGLRQSDALFFHTKALPELSKQLFESIDEDFKICAVGYSGYPRDIQGSYMPCFLAGKSFACGISYSSKVPLYCFSHQAGHIRAALYNSANKGILDKDIISFHISGGTSEIVFAGKCHKGEKVFDIKILGGSSDLNAGQAIDRLGVKLGMKFPCGEMLDRLSLESDKKYKPKVCVNGYDISFSGLENICEKMLLENASPGDTANYLFTHIAVSVDKVCKNLRKAFPDTPILFAGGVMANTIIRNVLSQNDNVYFALPDLSRDNACGISLMCEEIYNRNI